MEDRIEQLCREFIAEKNAEKARQLSGQLRTELHHFIETLRARVANYPVVEERRVQSAIPSAALPLSTNVSAAAAEPMLERASIPEPPAFED
jgi:hypothetical protein